MTEFANDLFSITAPAGWFLAEHEDGSGLTLATSEPARERLQQGGALQPGDQVLVISLTPAQLFQALYMSIEPGIPAEALSEAFLAKLAGVTGADASAPEVLALEDGRDLALRRAITERAEGAVMLLEIADGVLALSTMAASPGAYEEAKTPARETLSSLAFDGTVEALTAAINPAPPFDLFNQ